MYEAIVRLRASYYYANQVSSLARAKTHNLWFIFLTSHVCSTPHTLTHTHTHTNYNSIFIKLSYTYYIIQHYNYYYWAFAQYSKDNVKFIFSNQGLITNFQKNYWELQFFFYTVFILIATRQAKIIIMIFNFRVIFWQRLSHSTLRYINYEKS